MTWAGGFACFREVGEHYVCNIPLTPICSLWVGVFLPDQTKKKHADPPGAVKLLEGLWRLLR